MPKAPAPASTTRSTRSRYSSPHPKQTPNGGSEPSQSKAGTPTPAPADSQLARQQSMMKSWLEPPLNSKPSFQDEGLVRHGVVENMAPLGTLPKAGLFKKTSGPVLPPPEPRVQPTRIIFKNRPKPAAPPAPTPVDTPVAAPAPEEDETEEEEEEDEPLPYDQNGRRYSLQSGDGMDYSGYSRRSMSGASGHMGSISSSSYQHVQISEEQRLAELKDRTAQVIEKAVDEALRSFRYPTAFALRTLYDEKCDDPAFLGMIDRVFRQLANRQDLDRFRDLMAPKKKEGSKGNRACYHFIAPSTEAGFPPHVPKPAPYGHLIKFDLSIMRKEPTPERQSESDQSAPLQQLTSQREPTPARTPTPQPETKAEPEASPPPIISASRAASPAPAVASSSAPEPVPEPAPEPVAERAGKRELPQDEENPEQEPAAEAHVRKKRRSSRHSAAAAKMSISITNGRIKVKSPEKRRTRGRSHSSTSSLSSARSLSPPAEIQEDAEDAEVTNEPKETTETMEVEEANDVPPSRASPAAESVSSVTAPTKSTTKKPRRSLPARRGARASAATERSASKASTPARTRRSVANSEESTPAPDGTTGPHFNMPDVVDAPQVPQQYKGGYKGVIVFPSKVGKIDDNDPKLVLQRSARAVSSAVYQDAVTESHARDPAAEDRTTPEVAETAPPAPSSRSRASVPASRSTPAPANTRNTRSTRKRSHDELEEQSSPIVANFSVPDATSSTAANSRAATPALRAAKKARTGLRVKNSPVKKKTGTSAGIPRPSGERNSPSAALREDDNDDYCASCGGNGELICCDGCTRSFHRHCVDPVLLKEHDEWFCNVCRARLEPELPVHKGCFAPLLYKLDGKNTSAFRLPLEVRERFEGVRTGPDGEYEEITAAVPAVKPTRKKKNDDEVPDLFRLRDVEGNPIICHGCQKSSASNRAIIPCGSCGLHWHLDCLDPPMANPPVLRTWKCPCHIEEVLAKVPGTLGPAHRFRKIKNAPVIKPVISRGYINNGYIEVDDGDESPDESGWKDVETYGRIVRLPTKGIKLDFISRMRQNRKGKPIPPAAAAPIVAESQERRVLDKLELDKQQAARNLVQLSGQGTSGIDTLVDTLITEANPAVINLMARSSVDRIAEGQKLAGMDEQSLRAMLAQLDRMGDHVRQLLNSAAPAAQEATGRLASSTGPQPSTAGSEGLLAGQGKEKNLPSPALSRVDEEKALTPMRDGEDQLVGSSPTDGKSVADKDDMPVTPTDTRLVDGDDAVIVKEPQSGKTAVEIEDGGMDLD